MKFGYIPTEGGAYYQEFLDEVRLGEALGFDSVWLEEHHGVRDQYLPSPLIGLAGVATRPERILLGTDVMVLLFHHPVCVAEDTAMLDIMTGGREGRGATGCTASWAEGRSQPLDLQDWSVDSRREWAA